ncbi:MAG: GntR family transcriptional regulator [Burkholderiales bacterium]|nr:GntR family transcriptional regulator [Burkholderiales bacterium]
MTDRAKTLAESVADRLAEEIIRRELVPGTRLDEVSLAARFGVSRTPVRDALRLLAGTRLVDHRPRRGFCVAVVDQDELKDLFEAAGEIEALCAKLCALRAGPAERKRIEIVHQSTAAAAQAGDATTYASLNEQLHQLIYAGSRNGTLAELAASMRRRLAPFRAQLFFSRDNRMQGSHLEHDAIVRAILARDADGAANAMLEHSAQAALNVRTHLPRDEGSPVSRDERQVA